MRLMVMLNNLAVRLRREDGATMVEYGIMVALIAAIAIATVKLLGVDVEAAFNTIVTNM